MSWGITKVAKDSLHVLEHFLPHKEDALLLMLEG